MISQGQGERLKTAFEPELLQRQGCEQEHMKVQCSHT